MTDNGLTINEAGNYEVSFQAILLNLDPTYTPVIPVFVAINGVFDPTKPVNLGSVVTLPVGFPSAVHGSGVMQNVPAGTTLSLVATNGGSPQPQPVTVVAWDISVFKIPCKSKKS